MLERQLLSGQQESNLSVSKYGVQRHPVFNDTKDGRQAQTTSAMTHNDSISLRQAAHNGCHYLNSFEETREFSSTLALASINAANSLVVNPSEGYYVVSRQYLVVPILVVVVIPMLSPSS